MPWWAWLIIIILSLESLLGLMFRITIISELLTKLVRKKVRENGTPRS